MGILANHFSGGQELRALELIEKKFTMINNQKCRIIELYLLNLELVGEGLAGYFVELIGGDIEDYRAVTEIHSFGDCEFKIECSKIVGGAFSIQHFCT